MSQQYLLPNPPNLLHSPYKTVISSNSQLKRLSIKRSCPSRIEFSFEDATEINNSTFRRLLGFLSKRSMKLKNPPLKETLKNVRIAKHLRRLEVRPHDAAKYITTISRRFSNLSHLAILDETDIFLPIRVNKKVYSIRSLKSFVYNHELCKEFIKCARYVHTLKIRKICVDFTQLKKFQRLENICIILKTKYLTLPEEDRVCTQRLGNILLSLPLLKRVVLDHEIDAENYPFMFLDLVETLKDKAKVDLVADFVDVSNQRNKNTSIEMMIQALKESGIKSLIVNYVGVMKAVKRFGRTFYAPIHVKQELYLRFIKTLLEYSFEEIKFAPTIHSSYLSDDLKNSFLQLVNSGSKVKTQGLTVEYNLDLIDSSSLGLLLDLYNCNIPSYEIVITCTTSTLLKGLPDQLESHFSAVSHKLKTFKPDLSLRVSVKNLSVLVGTIQNIISAISKDGFSFLKGLNIQVTEPIETSSFANLTRLLTQSNLCKNIQTLELDIGQKETPSSHELLNLFNMVIKVSPNVRNVSLVYYNSLGYRNTIKNAIEKLRSQYFRTNFLYEVNRERVDFD